MSDDRDWRQYTRRGALGLMGVGAVTAGIAQTVGFSSVESGRGISIETAGDTNGYLTIVDSNSSSALSGTLPSPVTLEFTNNLFGDIGAGDLKFRLINRSSGTTLGITDSNGNFELEADSSRGSFPSSLSGTNSVDIQNTSSFSTGDTNSIGGLELDASESSNESIQVDLTTVGSKNVATAGSGVEIRDLTTRTFTVDATQ